MPWTQQCKGHTFLRAYRTLNWKKMFSLEGVKLINVRWSVHTYLSSSVTSNLKCFYCQQCLGGTFTVNHVWGELLLSTVFVGTFTVNSVWGELLLATVFGGTFTVNSVCGNFYCQQCLGELLLSTVFGGTFTVNSVCGNFYCQQCLGGGELLLSTVFGRNFYCRQCLGGTLTYLFNKVLQNAAANFCHLLLGSDS